MAVGTVGSASDKVITGTPDTDLNITHTVDAGTTALFLGVCIEGDESLASAPVWDSAGANETLTLINDSGVQSASDVRVYTYGLVNPTAGATKTLTITTSTTVLPGWAACRNYNGTNVASVAACFLHKSDDVETGNSTAAVHASAGSSGNALVFVGALQGGDGDPASNATSFTEVYDKGTGTDAVVDFSVYYAELLNAAPEAITVTWGASDQHTSSYIEIVASGAATSIMNQMQDGNLGSDLFNGTIQ